MASGSERTPDPVALSAANADLQTLLSLSDSFGQHDLNKHNRVITVLKVEPIGPEAILETSNRPSVARQAWRPNGSSIPHPTGCLLDS